MDGADDLGLRQRQEIVVALEVSRPVRKPFPTVVSFFESVGLNHRPHGAIQEQDAFLEKASDQGIDSGVVFGHEGGAPKKPLILADGRRSRLPMPRSE